MPPSEPPGFSGPRILQRQQSLDLSVTDELVTYGEELTVRSVWIDLDLVLHAILFQILLPFFSDLIRKQLIILCNNTLVRRASSFDEACMIDLEA